VSQGLAQTDEEAEGAAQTGGHNHDVVQQPDPDAPHQHDHPSVSHVQSQLRRVGLDLVQERRVQYQRNHVPQPPPHCKHSQLLNLHEEVPHHHSDHARTENADPHCRLRTLTFYHHFQTEQHHQRRPQRHSRNKKCHVY